MRIYYNNWKKNAKNLKKYFKALNNLLKKIQKKWNIMG